MKYLMTSFSKVSEGERQFLRTAATGSVRLWRGDARVSGKSRCGSGGERKDLIYHWAQAAFAVKLDHLSELARRAHRRAEDVKLLPKDAAHFDVLGRSGRRAVSHDASGGLDDFNRFDEGLAADA